ncbi:ligninase LG6 precursor [Stemphylium lycopersici]|uniref:Peroxidase n=1 Tax=Stemphylium lycopersici TaxID=183478 RepID=A0A364MY61_STELY|nr:ligninase LG6 precursor [Stemphylium lycopersici]
MHSFAIAILALAATPTSAALNIWPRAGDCPSVWSDVAAELQAEMAGCGANAHGAIRAPFHDCINNGCDGSLILSDECSRSENAGLSNICKKLKDWSEKFDVGAADMIQFAAATAISACPLGPKVQALVGRKDSKAAAASGSVPSSRDSVDSILSAFSAKGFSADDVVALMGTHSVALQFNDDPSQAGKSLDSTPSTYDNTFYKETKDGTAPYSLQSDRLLSNSSKTADTWSSFAASTDAWLVLFTDAWNRFAVVGNDAGSLQDCSSLIPSSSASRKRQMANARFTERMSAKFRL